MVLGLRTRTHENPSVQLDYIIHILEVKPWPPSQSLRTLRAVLIQWEHGETTSGFTNQVVPASDGRIEFNESFGLKVTLMREDTYHKNCCIEFHLYEPRRDKGLKSQLLGSAVLDLGAYGVIRENLSISTPIHCKRTYRNSAQPLLFLKIQPVEASSTMREATSMEKNRGESVSALMSEEYAEEAEVASFTTTDDDVSSHSSLAVTSSATDLYGSSPPLNKKNETAALNDSAGVAKVGRVPHQPDEEPATESSSMDLSSDIAWISKRINSHSLQSSAVKETNKWQSSSTKIHEHHKEDKGIEENVATGIRDVKNRLSSEPEESISTFSKVLRAEINHKTDKYFGSGSSTSAEVLLVAGGTNSPLNGCTDNETRQNHEQYVEVEGQEVENEVLNNFPQVDGQKRMTLENGLASSTKESVLALSSFSSKSSGSTRRNHSVTDTSRGLISSERKDAKASRKETGNLLSEGRIQQLEHRIKILEGELREAAALEVSLYSVVAEHGSSMNKVHAPARRLSRLYFNANKHNLKSGRENASKSVVCGLVSAAKACGNDVPRLTFWLSNTIVLRAIISKSFEDSQIHNCFRRGMQKAGEKNVKKKSSPLTWESFPSKITRGATGDSVGEKENLVAFVAGLEKAEAWIFSRIIESLWWQTFAPRMQTDAAKAIRTSIDSSTSKSYRRTSSWSEQGNFSVELWKKAFRDACERICPVRGGGYGHDCGCLPLLSKLIMEQVVARLDVAILNAILRESADEIPTDPVADPISDANVLPIPAGKASFGAGAQLKNAIGNWSRWLTDLFGMDDENNNHGSGSGGADDKEEEEPRSRDAAASSPSSKSAFCLLNALSDLMMLPKDMLLTPSIRKEVCPTFGLPLLSRILNSFVPDEFCPDPIPGALLEALNSQDLEQENSIMVNLPCEAAPIVYQAPLVDSVASIVGEIGGDRFKLGSSSLLKKSQTSDDELDQLNSPLRPLTPTPTSVRYQLLRQVWN